MAHYNMLVIGSGPAGQKAAIQGAKDGKRVGIVERKKFVGGICINSGTIPSKSLPAEALQYQMRSIGVTLRFNEEVTAVEKQSGRPVLIQRKSGKQICAALLMDSP